METTEVLEVDLRFGDWSRWFKHAAVAKDTNEQEWLIFPNSTGRPLQDQDDRQYPLESYFLAQKPKTSPTSLFSPVNQSSESNTNRIAPDLEGLEVIQGSRLTEPDLAAIATTLLNTSAGKLNAAHTFPFHSKLCDLSWVPSELVSDRESQLKPTLALPSQATRLERSSEQSAVHKKA